MHFEQRSADWRDVLSINHTSAAESSAAEHPVIKQLGGNWNAFPALILYAAAVEFGIW